MVEDDLRIISKLSPTGNLRITLYLAPSKVEGFYIQKVAQATEYIKQKNIKSNLSASFFDIIRAELSGMKGIEEKISMTPKLQAIVAERAARETQTLINLRADAPEPGELLYYVGNARLALMHQEVTPEKTGFSNEVCQHLEEVRKTQEQILQFKNKEIGTAVLTFQRNLRYYASIASSEFIDLSPASSYFTYTHFGILCTMEGPPSRAVTLLDPLWIWYEKP